PAIYTLSLHDALPICRTFGQRRRCDRVRLLVADRPARGGRGELRRRAGGIGDREWQLRGLGERRPEISFVGIRIGAELNDARERDRKSTRLNSSHVAI